MLRMESANQEIDGRQLPPLGESARPKYKLGFGECTREPSSGPLVDGADGSGLSQDLLKAWVEDNLDLYKASRTVPQN